MRTRKVIALSLLSAGALVLFSGCPAQPPGPCVVARAFASNIEGSNPGANYVVQYFFTAGSETGDCTTDPAVAAWPAGDFVGGIWAEAFGPVTAVNKVTGLVPDEFGWTNAYTGDYVEGSPNSATPVTDNPIILGHFTTDTEDPSGSCTITPTSPGVQLVNGVLVTYQYTTAILYVTAAAGKERNAGAGDNHPRIPNSRCCRLRPELHGAWLLADFALQHRQRLQRAPAA